MGGPIAILILLVAGALILIELGGNLGNLNFEQLRVLAEAAGFQGDDAITAAAIALAESSGNPKAYNPETAAGTPINFGSYGLWQIYLNAHPEFANQNLYDAATNARAAFSVYRSAGDSFTPWSTYKNAAYLTQIPSSVWG